MCTCRSAVKTQNRQVGDKAVAVKATLEDPGRICCFCQGPSACSQDLGLTRQVPARLQSKHAEGKETFCKSPKRDQDNALLSNTLGEKP
jgi:hypothetical protein